MLPQVKIDQLNSVFSVKNDLTADESRFTCFLKAKEMGFVRIHADDRCIGGIDVAAELGQLVRGAVDSN